MGLSREEFNAARLTSILVEDATDHRTLFTRTSHRPGLRIPRMLSLLKPSAGVSIRIKRDHA